MGEDSVPRWVTPCSGDLLYPPQGSPQLHHNDLNARMVKLSSDVLAATHEGYVLIGGDFNARVGSYGECFPEGVGMRGCTDATINGHGRRLLHLCNRTGLMLCTGRALGIQWASQLIAPPAGQLPLGRTMFLFPHHYFLMCAHLVLFKTGRGLTISPSSSTSICQPPFVKWRHVRAMRCLS